MNEEIKPNSAAEAIDDEMLDEYDFSNAVHGNPYQNLSRSPITIKANTGDRDIQIKTVEVSATVAIDGKVTLQLPLEITPGEHVSPFSSRKTWLLKLPDIAHSNKTLFIRLIGIAPQFSCLFS